MATVQNTPQEQKALSRWWNGLAPARRKQIVTFGTIGAVIVFGYALITVPTSSESTSAQTQPANALLPADEARDLGVNGVSMDVRRQNENYHNLDDKVSRLTSQLDRYTQANGESQSTKDQKLQASVDALAAQVSELKSNATTGTAGAAAGQPAVAPATPNVATPLAAPPAFGPIRTIGQDPHPNGAGSDGDKGADASRPSAIPSKASQFYLPSGSFVQAVLLTGVEAPTGQAAQRDPLPVLARIKHDAILPNFYSANIRECFVLLDAIGDLASERAMLRSENISCVLKDKSVIDVPIQGYGVGEDGKAGLHGRVVSKQGMVLRKAMLAGFADGVSKAFGAADQPVLASGQTQVSYGQTMQSGAMGGASSALDRIAQYYLELANELHPVIEVESGRQITLVVIHGRTMATVDPNAQTNAQANTGTTPSQTSAGNPGNGAR